MQSWGRLILSLIDTHMALNQWRMIYGANAFWWYVVARRNDTPIWYMISIVETNYCSELFVKPGFQSLRKCYEICRSRKWNIETRTDWIQTNLVTTMRGVIIYNTAGINVEPRLECEFTKDTIYLTLMGQVWALGWTWFYYILYTYHRVTGLYDLC